LIEGFLQDQSKAKAELAHRGGGCCREGGKKSPRASAGDAQGAKNDPMPGGPVNFWDRSTRGKDEKEGNGRVPRITRICGERGGPWCLFSSKAPHALPIEEGGKEGDLPRELTSAPTKRRDRAQFGSG